MCTVFPQILALVCKPHNMLIRVTVSRPDVACRNLTQTRQHNVFVDCLLETKKGVSFLAEGNASALVVADTLRMAIPIIMGGNSGSSKKGEIQGLLTSSLRSTSGWWGGGGVGGGGVVGAFTCNVLLNYLAKTPIIPNNST